jgi:hypothetical protein
MGGLSVSLSAGARMAAGALVLCKKRRRWVALGFIVEGGARWGSRPGTHGAERRSRREVAAQVAGGQRLFVTTAVRDRGEETDR